MYTIIGLLFCLLLGIMVKDQGISALLWVPVGFVVGLYVSAQIVLPLILGVPRAVSLIRKGRMRRAALGYIIVRVALWVVGCFAVFFAIGFVFPSLADRLSANRALNLSLALGTLAIFLSPFSKKSRADFRDDFDSAYGRFYVAEVKPPPMV